MKNEKVNPSIVEFEKSERRHGNIAVQFAAAATLEQAQQFAAAYYGHDVSPQQVKRDFDMDVAFFGGEHLASVTIPMISEQGKRENAALIAAGGETAALAIYRMAGRVILQRQINESRS